MTTVNKPKEGHMNIDMKRSPYQKHWWDENVIRLVVYISRNDLVWIAVAIAIAILYFKFPIHWDWVFGRR